MSTQFSIQIEKTETGYLAYSPEILDSQVQGDSFETVVEVLKPIISDFLKRQEDLLVAANHRPIWDIAQDLTRDMTDEEIRQLPTDGAEQHDHYIYGIPKRT